MRMRQPRTHLVLGPFAFLISRDEVHLHLVELCILVYQFLLNVTHLHLYSGDGFLSRTKLYKGKNTRTKSNLKKQTISLFTEVKIYR